MKRLFIISLLMGMLACPTSGLGSGELNGMGAVEDGVARLVVQNSLRASHGGPSLLLRLCPCLKVLGTSWSPGKGLVDSFSVQEDVWSDLKQCMFKDRECVEQRFKSGKVLDEEHYPVFEEAAQEAFCFYENNFVQDDNGFVYDQKGKLVPKGTDEELAKAYQKMLAKVLNCLLFIRLAARDDCPLTDVELACVSAHRNRILCMMIDGLILMDSGEAFADLIDRVRPIFSQYLGEGDLTFQLKGEWYEKFMKECKEYDELYLEQRDKKTRFTYSDLFYDFRYEIDQQPEVFREQLKTSNFNLITRHYFGGMILYLFAECLKGETQQVIKDKTVDLEAIEAN